MGLNKTLLAAAVSLALGGCIDSGGDDAADAGTDSGGADSGGAERISFTGLVADGYLDGATVCLDINENK